MRKSSKTQKLRLSELQVKSFVTLIDKSVWVGADGGISKASEGPGIICSVSCDNIPCLNNQCGSGSFLPPGGNVGEIGT